MGVFRDLGKFVKRDIHAMCLLGLRQFFQKTYIPCSAFWDLEKSVRRHTMSMKTCLLDLEKCGPKDIPMKGVIAKGRAVGSIA